MLPRSLVRHAPFLATISMSTPLSLEQFAALNDELAALARAGIPLEKGLSDLAPSLPGKMSRLTAEMAKRLAAGESLTAVLNDPQWQTPPGYAVIVEAGARSGRLSAALQDVAEMARRIRDLQRYTLLAFVYPTIIVVAAYALLMLGVVWVIPHVLDAYEPLTESPPRHWQWLLRVCETWPYWAPWPPIALLALLVWQWRRAAGFHRRSTHDSPFRRTWLSSPARVLALARLATLLDLLDLLLAYQTPLPDAIELAANASGATVWQRGAGSLATRLRAGERLTWDLIVRCGLPSALGWIAASPANLGGATAERPLRRAASDCWRRADRELNLLSRRLPLQLELAAGFLVALPVVLIVLVPWIDLLKRLASP